MDEPIKIEDEILNKIEKDYYYTGILTRKGVFNFYADLIENL